MLIQLTPNPLTPSDNDYTAIVKHQGTLTLEEIVARIIRRGTEADATTLVDYVRKFEREVVEALAQGYMVDTTLYHARTTVGGVFVGKAAPFDPAQGHSLGVALNICPPALATIAQQARVENIGVLPVGPQISTVEDVFTRTIIGTTTQGSPDAPTTRTAITPTRTLRLRGKNLRVAWDSEADHPTRCGVFLVRNDASQARSRIADADLVVNHPTELVIQLPTLAPGSYWLEVITQSSGKGRGTTTELVKEPRTIRFELPLTVE